ncbi:MAG: 1-phosphofructokinase [Candidatus Omnitrophica bacterium]|nr:1-phosphofructokinase [Candidatus Omnitrophota bacterium]
MIVTVTLNPSLDEWVALPRLRLGELNRAARTLRYAGGKGVNVSRVVHELRGRALAVALAGGHDGVILGELLREQGIAYRFITVPGSTRNNYQIQTTAPRTLTQINCPGPRVSLRTAGRVLRVLRTLRSLASCVVFSGSLPPGLPAGTYRRLIDRCRARRLPTVLDSSGAALRAGLAARPWLVKPNRSEAEELLGRRLRTIKDASAAAAHLTRRGPVHILISLGVEGAVLASRTHPSVLWAQAPRVRTGSAVGAGDSLVAGFMVGWSRTRSLHQALRLGVACGTAAAMTPGTELCHRADVHRLLGRVRLRVL